MSDLPSSVLERLWVQVAALRPARSTTHSAAIARAFPARVIFDKLIQVLVFGCGYRRIADSSCSATTLAAGGMSGSAPGWPSSCARRC